MKSFRNNLIFKVQVIVILTTLAASTCVYGVVYTLSYNAIMNDIRERANSVKGYVQEILTTKSFEEISGSGGFGATTYLQTQETLSNIRGVANIQRLYTAKEDEAGEIVIIMNSLYPEGGEDEHILTGEMAADLRLCLRQGQVVRGKGIYHAGQGSVYVIYWPVLDKDHMVVGAVGMEFNVDSIYNSYRKTGLYSLALSSSLIALFCLIAYLSLKKVSEPFYKKLAYTDFLTGLQNRMAFEQRLMECEALLPQGRSVTLVIFDLNNLKTVNDTQGHRQGDSYMKNTVQYISRSLHGLGELYRIGGDEFAAIVVDGEGEMQKALHALRREKGMVLKNHPFDCACGSATFMPGVDKSLRDVFGRADNEMYAEKRKRKDLLAV